MQFAPFLLDTPSRPLTPPIIVHHMAAFDGAAPPNSLAAIQASLDAHAAFIEIDVTALATGDYLLVHDPVLESETTGYGEVGGHTPDQMHGLFIRWRGQATRHPVPLLSEVIALMAAHPHKARLQIDYKNMIPFASNEPIERFVRLIEPLKEQVIVSTGADWQLRKMRHAAPWLELGFDIHFYIDWRAPGTPVHPLMHPKILGAHGYWDDHPIAASQLWDTATYLNDRCEALIALVPGVTTFYISHVFLAQCLADGFNWAERLHRAGIKTDAWTLDVGNPIAESNAKRLLDAGVDQFTTNTPRELAGLLGV
jgi:glycerophosphoryl diester phosphodiesterase